MERQRSQVSESGGASQLSPQRAIPPHTPHPASRSLSLLPLVRTYTSVDFSVVCGGLRRTPLKPLLQTGFLRTRCVCVCVCAVFAIRPSVRPSIRPPAGEPVRGRQRTGSAGLEDHGQDRLRPGGTGRPSDRQVRASAERARQSPAVATTLPWSLGT